MRGLFRPSHDARAWQCGPEGVRIFTVSEAVSTVIVHQNGRMRGIRLDLLAQTIDVRSYRMGARCGTIAPYSL
jgi:hypothetical protein